MKVNFKSIIVLVVIIAIMLAAVSFFTDKKDDKVTELSYGELIELLRTDSVYSLKIDGDYVVHVKIIVFEETPPEDGEDDEVTPPVEDGDDDAITPDEGADEGVITVALPLEVDNRVPKMDGNKYVTYSGKYKLVDSVQRETIEEFCTGGTLTYLGDRYDITPPAETPWYVSYLPYIILAVVLIVMWIFVMKSAGGMGGKMNSFSKSKAKVTSNDKDAVKFADVAGADEEKAELEEVVEFLKDPSKFVKLGARIPRGVLLVGPPGTGKTLLAKAVAGEAGVPFFSISGSDFVEMYVGVGASRVRDLFDNARKTPASIIFIDEIDAVGRHRGAGLGGGHDEREQTLNQLLVEMDGFGTNSGVIVMAATNRPDILDPALLRPGRFDRRVTVNYPDMKGREAILKVHCRNKPLEEAVDLYKIAQTTIGFTGAELANLMNEAALRAAKKGKSLIGMEDIEESYMKLILGPQKKSKVRTAADNKLCAYHEAGHAVSSYYCKHTDPVKHITIIPAGSAGGVTVSVPTEDRMTMSKNAMLDELVLCLGGRLAEKIVLDDISTGASNDISQATRIAHAMVTRYGMSDKLGTVLYGSEHTSDEVFLGRDFSSGKNYSEKTAAEIDDEVREIIANAHERCEKILREHIDKLHFVAGFLLKNEFMDEDQFRACMESENPTVEEIEAIAEERKRKSAEENKNASKIDDFVSEREALAKEALEANEIEGRPDDFGIFDTVKPSEIQEDSSAHPQSLEAQEPAEVDESDEDK